MIHDLRDSLTAVQCGQMDATQLVTIWRAQPQLMQQLPGRCGQVMEDLLMRLESSRLFFGGACAFRSDDLVAALQLWLDRAEKYLAGELVQGDG
jgi:hypothetical protein